MCSIRKNLIRKIPSDKLFSDQKCAQFSIQVMIVKILMQFGKKILSDNYLPEEIKIKNMVI